MKRMLQKGRYLWNAKGRHGTHSPFVYTFVELVMRAKSKFNLVDPSGNPASFSKRTINHLGRTIQFLNPEIVYADSYFMPFVLTLKAENPALAFEISLFPLETADYDNGGFFFCQPTEGNTKLLEPIIAKQTGVLILPGIHLTEVHSQIWQQFSRNTIGKMVMDVWDFGVISNHPDFKTKQYFRLR